MTWVSLSGSISRTKSILKITALLSSYQWLYKKILFLKRLLVYKITVAYQVICPTLIVVIIICNTAHTVHLWCTVFKQNKFILLTYLTGTHQPLKHFDHIFDVRLALDINDTQKAFNCRNISFVDICGQLRDHYICGTNQFRKPIAL